MTRAERDAKWAGRIAPGWLRSGRSYAGKIYLPSDSTPAARPGADTADAAVSKLPNAAVPSAAGHICRCGRDKKPGHVVCNSCWFSSPLEVRHELKRGDLPARRAALRLLLEAASGRRVLRSLRDEKGVRP